MTTEQFNALVHKLDSYAQETMNKKGPEYTMQDKDVLNNFKSTAKKLGVVSPLSKDIGKTRNAHKPHPLHAVQQLKNWA